MRRTPALLRTFDAAHPLAAGRHAADHDGQQHLQRMRQSMSDFGEDGYKGARAAQESLRESKATGKLDGMEFMKHMHDAACYDFSSIEATMEGNEDDMRRLMMEVIARLRAARARLRTRRVPAAKRVKTLDGDHTDLPRLMWALARFFDNAEPVVAAPMIGLDLRVLLLRDGGSFVGTGRAPQLLICDPLVTHRSPEMVTTWETCPCVPGVVVRTARRASIGFGYWSASPFSDMTASGINGRTAITVQRGLDYLDNKYIVDRKYGDDAVVPYAEYLANREVLDAQVDVPGDDCNILLPPGGVPRGRTDAQGTPASQA